MDKAIHVIFSYSFRNALGSLDVNVLEGEIPTDVMSFISANIKLGNANFVG